MPYKRKPIVDGKKECTGECKQWKPIGQYSIRGYAKSGKAYYNSECHDCMNERSKRYNKRECINYAAYQIAYRIGQLRVFVSPEHWPEARERILDAVATVLAPGGKYFPPATTAITPLPKRIHSVDEIDTTEYIDETGN